jgi:hypothetical protein
MSTLTLSSEANSNSPSPLNSFVRGGTNFRCRRPFNECLANRPGIPEEVRESEPSMTSVTYPDLMGKSFSSQGHRRRLARKPRASLLLPGQGSSSMDAMNRRLSGSPVRSRSEGGECIGIAADVTSTGELIRLQPAIQDRFGDVSVFAMLAGGLVEPSSCSRHNGRAMAEDH